MFDPNTMKFMRKAIALSRRNVRLGKGGPFGAVVVKDGVVIAQGVNRVPATNDPTAYAEVVALRKACKKMGSFQLTGCDIYSSCEPCPMCMAAIYWARPARVFFANTKEDAAAIGFDDCFIYQQLALPPDARKIQLFQMMRAEAITVFHEWNQGAAKTKY